MKVQSAAFIDLDRCRGVASTREDVDLVSGLLDEMLEKHRDYALRMPKGLLLPVLCVVGKC